MNKKILTISVAAYNVEKYLAKLIESVIAADRYGDVELIIVNDGSKDGTQKIAEHYEQKYPDTIRLVNKENGGHGSAVNWGIRLAEGKYFRALDGDDWVDVSGTQKLIELLKGSSADLVLTDFLQCFTDKTVEKREFPKLKPYNLYPLNAALKKTDWMPYHTVIYKTRLLQSNGISVDEKCFYEDNEYCIYPLKYVKTLIYFDLYCYCYRYGEAEQSVSMLSRKKHIDDSSRVCKSLIKYLNQERKTAGTQLTEYMVRNTARMCMWHINSLLSFAPDRKRKAEIIKFDNYIQDHAKDVYIRTWSVYKNRNRILQVYVNLLRKTDFKIYRICGWLKQLIPVRHFTRNKA